MSKVLSLTESQKEALIVLLEAPEVNAGESLPLQQVLSKLLKEPKVVVEVDANQAE